MLEAQNNIGAASVSIVYPVRGIYCAMKLIKVFSNNFQLLHIVFVVLFLEPSIHRFPFSFRRSLIPSRFRFIFSSKMLRLCRDVAL